MKRILCLFFVVSLVLSLAGCQGGVNRAQADAEIAAFFDKVASEDFEGATAYLHPTNATDLQTLFAQSDIPADFAVEDIVNFSWSWYSSDVDGSQYTREYRVTTGEQHWTVSVQIVQNDAGYGIYDLTITPAGK